MTDAALRDLFDWGGAETIERARRVGWQPTDTARVTALAEHALAVDRGYVAAEWPGDTPQVRWVIAGLAEHALRLWAQVGLPRDEAFGWVAVFAGCPDIGAARRSVALPDATLRDWSRWAGQAAPLAWAAGLTPEETAAGLADGTLDVRRLRLLAGLRGYLLIGRETLGAGTRRG